MKRHDSYRFFVLIALCLFIPPHQVLAAGGTDSSPTVSKDVASHIPGSKITLPSTYSIAPENCTPYHIWVFAGDSTPVSEMRDLSFHAYRGMNFDNEMSTNFWKALPPENNENRMVSTRRCNLHLDDGTEITSIRGHTKVTNDSTVVISLVERSVDIGARDIVEDSIKNSCMLYINGQDANHDPSKTKYSRSCDLVIDNKSNSYDVIVHLNNEPNTIGEFKTTIRTVELDYFPPP